MKNRPWTPEEKQYLRKHYGTKDVGEIAKRLGRTRDTLYQTARNMGLAKESNQCGVAMGKALSPAQCRAMRRFLGVLLRAHDKNPDLNIGTFMTAYRKYIAGREVMLYDVI